MRRTIVTLLLLAVAVWFAPPQLEDVPGQCRALEQRILRIQALQTDAGKEDPVLAAAVAKRVLEYAGNHHRTLPSGLGCAMVYWDFVFDADLSLFQKDATTTR